MRKSARRSPLITISGNIGSGYSSFLLCDVSFDDFNLEVDLVGVWPFMCLVLCCLSALFNQ